MLRFTEWRTREALGRFAHICAVEVTLAVSARETTCRVIITFDDGRTLAVGHSAPGALHAVETAVETSAHIVASQTQAAPPTRLR